MYLVITILPWPYFRLLRWTPQILKWLIKGKAKRAWVGRSPLFPYSRAPDTWRSSHQSIPVSDGCRWFTLKPCGSLSFPFVFLFRSFRLWWWPWRCRKQAQQAELWQRSLWETFASVDWNHRATYLLSFDRPLLDSGWASSSRTTEDFVAVVEERKGEDREGKGREGIMVVAGSSK